MDTPTRAIYWNESAGGWYDVETDVSVKNMTRPDPPIIPAAVAPTTSIRDAMCTINDLAELLGWPCIDSDRADDNFSMQFKRGGYG